MKPATHCHCCGTPYNDQQNWPRVCPSCANHLWPRTDTVAVLLQPVLNDTTGKMGLIIVERGIEPFIGQFALPGGFLNPGESIEDGALREMFEETGIQSTDPVYIKSCPIPGQVITFFKATVKRAQTIVFVPSHETPSYRITYEPELLCFPTHTQIVEEFFAGIPDAFRGYNEAL